MKLYYKHYGSGDPVIILHGLLGSSDNWVTIGRHLAENFTVYIPDQRNHGHSPHSQIFNYHVMADDLMEFITDHDITTTILIGHSMGGKVAMTFTLDNPSLVEKMVVVDISPRAMAVRDDHLRIIKAMEAVDFKRITSRAEAEEIIAGAIEEERIRLFILKNLHRTSHDRLGWRINLQAIYDNLVCMSEGVESEQPYQNPVLFVKGGLSDYIVADDLPMIKKLFPQAIIHTIANATHWVNADKPDDVCKVLSRFLGKECTI
jgi:esterase